MAALERWVLALASTLAIMAADVNAEEEAASSRRGILQSRGVELKKLRTGGGINGPQR